MTELAMILKPGRRRYCAPSIRRWRLDVIHDQDLHGSAPGFKFQPELLLERGEEGRL